MSDTDQPPSGALTPIPSIGFSEILGLLEVLKSMGGRVDIYKLAGELKMELGETLSVIRAAELLKLVHTPGGDVVLEPFGEKVTQAKIHERKELIADQMEKIPVIGKILEFLENSEEKEAEKDDVIERLAELLPNEYVEESFNNVVAWGRYAELFAYNDDTHTLYIDESEED